MEAKIQVLDVHGNPIDLPDTPLDTPRGDETEGEPKPVVNTAFAVDVWPRVLERQQASAAELQETIDEATQAMSEIDFGSGAD